MVLSTVESGQLVRQSIDKLIVLILIETFMLFTFSEYYFQIFFAFFIFFFTKIPILQKSVHGQGQQRYGIMKFAVSTVSVTMVPLTLFKNWLINL